jgi:hypothetical protein
MKKMLLVTTFCALIVVFCGAPQEKPKAEKPAGQTQAEVYYASLSENEIQRFIKAMPTFKAAVEKLDEKMGSLEGPGMAKAMLGQYAMINKQIPDLDAKLRAAGMPWDEFWPAFGKTMTATVAVIMDSMMTQMKEQMKGQPAGAVEQAMKGMEETSAAYKDVPQANKDLVKKHMKELAKVFEMD